MWSSNATSARSLIDYGLVLLLSCDPQSCGKAADLHDHYDKLEWIKNKYDPTSLFVVASGVGSDKWDEQLVCRCQI